MRFEVRPYETGDLPRIMASLPKLDRAPWEGRVVPRGHSYTATKNDKPLACMGVYSDLTKSYRYMRAWAIARSDVSKADWGRLIVCARAILSEWKDFELTAHAETDVQRRTLIHLGFEQADRDLFVRRAVWL